MSIEALKWAFEQEQVPPGPRFVLVALANRANEEGGDLYPSLRWIKKKTGIPERTIREHIKELMRLGLLLKTTRTRDDGGQTSNEYLLPLTQPGLRFDPPAAIAGGDAAIAVPGATSAEPPCRSLPGAPAATAGHKTKEETKETKKGAAARRTRLPAGFAVSENVRRWYAGKGYPAELLPVHFETFVRKVEANGSKYVDWDKAFENAIADDWGDVRWRWMSANGKRDAAPLPTAWHMSAEGVRAKAKELGVEHSDDPDRAPAENFLWLKAKTCAAAGEGPWNHDKSDTFQRLLKRARELKAVPA